MSPKVLVIDIETSPIVAFVWQLYDQNVAINQIKTEWSILSYAAKWLGEKKILYEDTGGRGVNKVRDDKKLMQGLWDLFDQADLVVGQNHKKFDIRKINARLIEHGFKPYSPFRAIDTMAEARRVAAFTSKKLEWMSAHLTDTPKDTHKEFPGFDLWTECLKDNPKAWAQMKKYNVRDVEATEKVYLKLRPWIARHPNVGVYIQDKKPVCPACASNHLQRRGYAMSQAGSYTRWQCMECGAWAKGRFTQLAKEVRKELVTN